MLEQSSDSDLEIGPSAVRVVIWNADTARVQRTATAGERLTAIEWLVIADAARENASALRQSRAYSFLRGLYGPEAVDSGGRLDVLYTLSIAVMRQGARRADAELLACRRAGWSEALLNVLLDSLEVRRSCARSA